MRGDDGQYVEIRILESSDAERAFAAGRFKPKPHVYFLCTAAEATWGTPPNVLERFTSGMPRASSRTLDLSQGNLGEALGDRLSIYRNRWPLIAEFRKYRSTLRDPMALQMMLAMG